MWAWLVFVAVPYSMMTFPTDVHVVWDRSVKTSLWEQWPAPPLHKTALICNLQFCFFFFLQKLNPPSKSLIVKIYLVFLSLASLSPAPTRLSCLALVLIKESLRELAQPSRGQLFSAKCHHPCSWSGGHSISSHTSTTAPPPCHEGLKALTHTRTHTA